MTNFDRIAISLLVIVAAVALLVRIGLSGKGDADSPVRQVGSSPIDERLSPSESLPPVVSEIEVRSNVSGDMVSVNDNAYGSTPVRVTLEPGRHLVEVSRQSCVNYREWVEVAPGSSHTIWARLNCQELEAREQLASVLAAGNEEEVRLTLESLRGLLGDSAVGDADIVLAESWLRERATRADRLAAAEAATARERAARMAEEQRNPAGSSSRRGTLSREGDASNSGLGSQQLEVPPEGTVLDLASSLMWTKADNGSPIDWEGSQRYCEGLGLGGFTDWRLPTIAELEGLYRPQPASGVHDFGTYWIKLGIELSSCCPWTSTLNRRSKKLFFSFNTGNQGRIIIRANDLRATRALCVREAGLPRNPRGRP